MKHFQDYNENYDPETEYSGIRSQKDLYAKKKDPSWKYSKRRQYFDPLDGGSDPIDDYEHCIKHFQD